MRKELKAILLHTVEALVVIGVALGISKFFDITAEQYQLLLVGVLAAFAKLGRVATTDYVNK